jgi:hypothetical protein
LKRIRWKKREPEHPPEMDLNVEKIITDIEELEDIFSLSDTRPLTASDVAAANRRHDEKMSQSPWFRLWQQYGLCCRTEAPVLRLPE